MRVSGTNSIAYRMRLTVLLASSMALITLTLALLAFDTVSSRSLLQNRLSTLADIVGQNATAALNFNDPPAAVEVLEALRADPPVVSACLYDLSGHLFAQYNRDLKIGDCAPDTAQLQVPFADHPSVNRPIVRHGELVGALFLTCDLQDLDRRQRHLLLVAALLAVLALIVGGISATHSPTQNFPAYLRTRARHEPRHHGGKLRGSRLPIGNR